MWKVEDVLRDLKEEGIFEENNGEKEGGLPPGFRFHPTDEELITFYLASKVFNITNTNLFLSNNNTYHSGVKILEVDLSRCEPWDLPERAKMGEREWYLYSLRDRKYPSGLRTNRATETGYWKATGKDRQVYATALSSATTSVGIPLIGMKKTLVFYQGRAPRGLKTNWIMHEYRLDGHFSSFRLSSKEEWVICRIFHKNNAAEKKYSPQIHHPPSPSSASSMQPLSPFLSSSLPPLSEPPNNPTTTITTQSVADTLSQPRHEYDLLHSLLINPLPNFSSISESSNTIIFPPPNNNANIIQTTSAASGDLLARFKERCLSSTTISSSIGCNTTTTAVTKQQQQQQQWVDRIWNAHQNDYYFQNQPLGFNQMMDLPNNEDDDDDVKGVEMSPSLAVAALDRMLNHTTSTTINNHPPATQSWSFPIHHP